MSLRTEGRSYTTLSASPFPLPDNSESRTGFRTEMKAAAKKVRILFGRAKSILKQEGLASLFANVFRFLADLFFVHETYYLFEYTAQDATELNEADFFPKTDEFTFRIITTTKEANELGLRAGGYKYAERLDKGAIAACIFVEQDLAHVTWIALTEEAWDPLRRHLYKVDFSNGEYCLWDSWTNPKYRRNGFAVYAFLKATLFLHENGMTRSRAAILKSNSGSITSYVSFNAKRYAEARYLKLFWWEFRKENLLKNC